MSQERYTSPFTPVDLILIGGFAFAIDALNLMTFFIFAIIINPIAFIIFRLIFWLMKVNNAASFIGFLSPTAYVVATYMLEKAKERSPMLAKADEAAKGAGTGIKNKE